MPAVLNPGLYSRLKKHFGAVKIVNAGEAFLGKAVQGLEKAPRLSLYSDCYAATSPGPDDLAAVAECQRISDS